MICGKNTEAAAAGKLFLHKILKGMFLSTMQSGPCHRLEERAHNSLVF